MKFLPSHFKFFLLFFLFPLITKSENWPGWRGPNGDGSGAETNLPVKWDTITNVLWKVTIPGNGYASPIIWDDKLFTVAAIPESQEKILLCYNAQNGKLIWQTTVLRTKFEQKHEDNSFASGTPATDGQSVYVSFLEGDSVVVAAYDFNGKKLWMTKPGTFSSEMGHSTSPVICRDKIIINGDSEGDAFVAALSKIDGHTIWKVLHQKKFLSYSTPIIREIDGRIQIIYCGNQEIAAYNPQDGSRFWTVQGPADEFCSSPVYSEKLKLVFTCSSYPKRILVAINPTGNGDVTNSNIVWQSAQGGCFVPSPILAGDYLLSTMTNGTVHCLEAATGKSLWNENLGKQYPSAIYAGGLVYMPNDAGVITVIRPGPKFECVSKNSIGEKMFASPAICKGRFYLRGDKHLYCIGTH